MFYKVCPAYRVIYCMLFIVVVFYLHCKAHLNALRANLSAIEMLYYYYYYIQDTPYLVERDTMLEAFLFLLGLMHPFNTPSQFNA